ncbi:general secretion pathway protein GspB [Vibrio methylphosphonaticus]|uniref:general secretion pathway protein GspB n=1 Tax=Vibrio methylphosphonaticus TaxID=2946866 RepID=UPI00202A070A|nr:general secretion pathway protein GspB [Vibrio methylphosphonaticus]MCL9775094.1 general secretion pathway protein GspB [Vibrio methylphosphonaticus]
MPINFIRTAILLSSLVVVGVSSAMASESELAGPSPAIEQVPQTLDDARISPDYIALEYPDFGALKVPPEKTLAPTNYRQKPSTAYVAETQTVEKNTLETPLIEQASSDEPFTLDSLDLSGLDPDIARKVASAMNNIDQQSTASSSHISLEDNTSKYQGRLPPLNLQTHMYSSDSQRRWIQINGHELREGDRLDNIQIVEITPQLVTIRFDNELIDIPALYEWEG